MISYEWKFPNTEQIDLATTTDSMLELMTYSNDGKEEDQIKTNANSGLKFPQKSEAEQPFSLDLDICINNSQEPIPYSRTGDIELELILQSVVNSGLIYAGSSDHANVQLGYYMNNLEVRYMADEEQKIDGAIVMETKSSSHIITVQNKLATAEWRPAHAFDSVVMSFRKSGNRYKKRKKNLPTFRG